MRLASIGDWKWLKGTVVFLSGGLRARAAPIITYIAFNVRGYSRLLVIAIEDFVGLSSSRVTYRESVVSFSNET